MSEVIKATNFNGGIMLECNSEDRIVIVINPTTIEGGTIMYDKTVPVNQSLSGNITIGGQLSDVVVP